MAASTVNSKRRDSCQITVVLVKGLVGGDGRVPNPRGLAKQESIAVYRWKSCDKSAMARTTSDGLGHTRELFIREPRGATIREKKPEGLLIRFGTRRCQCVEYMWADQCLELYKSLLWTESQTKYAYYSTTSNSPLLSRAN